MKKLLIVLVALAVLLVGCSSIVGTPDNSTTPTTVSTPGNTTSPETTCHVLHNQLRMLTQEVQQENADLVAVRGDTQATGAIKVKLVKLHLRFEQVQTEYKGCPVNS